MGAPPRWFEPQSLWYVGRLGVPHIPTYVPSPLSVLPSRLKSMESMDFSLWSNPCLTHIHKSHESEPLYVTQVVLSAGCQVCRPEPLPQLLTIWYLSCLSQLLGTRTRGGASVTYVQNGSHPLSTDCQEPLWVGQGRKNMPPFSTTLAGILSPTGLQAGLMPGSSRSCITSGMGCCILILSHSAKLVLKFTATGVLCCVHAHAACQHPPQRSTGPSSFCRFSTAVFSLILS